MLKKLSATFFIGLLMVSVAQASDWIPLPGSDSISLDKSRISVQDTDKPGIQRVDYYTRFKSLPSAPPGLFDKPPAFYVYHFSTLCGDTAPNGQKLIYTYLYSQDGTLLDSSPPVSEQEKWIYNTNKATQFYHYWICETCRESEPPPKP